MKELVHVIEAMDWGWQGRDIEASDVIMQGGTVYLTRADKHKDQRYFDDFQGKSIWGILGYNGFANFNGPDCGGGHRAR